MDYCIYRNGIKPQTGIGKANKEDILGFMLHSSLVVDAHKSSALGYSYIKLWSRVPEAPDRHIRKYKRLPIREKESYKWIEAVEQSKTLLAKADSVMLVADRESDIYDLLSITPTQNSHVLIRSNADRKILEAETLTAYLTSQQEVYYYDLAVRGDIRKHIEKRIAKMQVKWGKVSILKPESCYDKTLAMCIPMYVVEAKELDKTQGIYWRLLTTHKVENASDAVQMIKWYKQRWYIEQVHRLLKTEGFRIEQTQLEQGWAIRKLTLLAMMAVLRILQMMLAYEDDHEQPIEEVFTEEEQQCLAQINAQMQGESEKLKNNAPDKTLKWATWIIARLGGWKGYASSRKPRPIVLQKGLIKFYHIYQGWLLFKNST